MTGYHLLALAFILAVIMLGLVVTAYLRGLREKYAGKEER
jgi:hypothetical protein